MKENKITQGNIPKQLLSYFFPLLVGSVFQMFYNTADSIIVGRFVGSDALAAVGGTGIIMGLIVGFFASIAGGATVIVSQYYGAKDYDNLSKAIHTDATLAIVGGLIIMAIGEIAAVPLLKVINIDPSIRGMSAVYLRTIFAGMPFFAMYNLGSGVLRALGDSKRPRNYLIVTCLLNIALDIVFVRRLKWSVFGVAFATIISVAVSSTLVMRAMMTEESAYRLDVKKLGIDKKILKDIIRIGLPSGGQTMAYIFANMGVQAAVNSFGAVATAAWVAFGKIDNLIFMVQGSFGMATTTFVGQNYGARRYDRVKESVRTGMIMRAVSTLVLSTVIYIFAPNLISIFAKEEEMIEIGTTVLRMCGPFYTTYTLIEILSGAIRGSGQAFVPMLITMVCICAFRLVWVYMVVPVLGGSIKAIAACFPTSWILAGVVFLLYYMFYRRKFSPDAENMI
jgi:putative MATE family efflux protein